METFMELLKPVRIPCRYFCRHSFTIWYVPPPSEVLAVKLAGNNVSTKHFWVQLEYIGKRQIRVTVCNILLQLNGDVLGAYKSAYKSVDELMQISADGTAHGDYVLSVCMDKEGFQAISHILTYKDQHMMVVIEGRVPLC